MNPTFKDSTDNDDCTSDDGKRKRDDKEENVFIKSKKTYRSPEKKAMERSDPNEELREMLRTLLIDNKNKANEIVELKEMMGSMIVEMKDIRKKNNEYKNQMNRLVKENEELKNSIKEMKQRMDNVESALEMFQRDKKRNNLIVKGLKIDTNENEIIKEAMENFMKKELETEVEINKAYKINEKTCIMELKHFEDKIKMLRAKGKLINRIGETIYIDCDLTRKEQETQKRRTIGKHPIKNTEQKNKAKEIKVRIGT
ncbi:hypothetical protein Zmor_010306 [Zophobas morio]|uniref:Uncharacterized protein n=1 Tax=Zophobas morio TaxID=2755281 RepID=A0AA38ISJ2_9CUCU|nr:hypothetical protein Zmor_010306 [Zophobas morio]